MKNEKTLNSFISLNTKALVEEYVASEQESVNEIIEDTSIEENIAEEPPSVTISDKIINDKKTSEETINNPLQRVLPKRHRDKTIDNKQASDDNINNISEAVEEPTQRINETVRIRIRNSIPDKYLFSDKV